MKRFLASLRGRLVCAMLLVFGLGLLAAVLVDPPEGATPNPDSWAKTLEQEPYQDFLVLIPYTAAAVAIMWIVSAWSLKQLSRASRDAARIGPGTSGTRIATERLPTEVQPLVAAFNGALDRLGDAYEAEQRLVAQVAHQLRTPLAVLSLRVQRARSGAALELDAIEGDLRDLNRFVDRLLDLAHKEHARRGVSAQQRVPVNLSRVGREAAAALVPLFDHAFRKLAVDLPASLPVLGRSTDLHDLLTNLLENALRHGKGAVSLAGEVIDHDGHRWAVLRVGDEGPGVPAGIRARAFARFARGDAQTGGHGLGLAIVKEVAEGHDGSVSIVDGPGCCFRVLIPLADDAAMASASERRPAGALAGRPA